MSASTEHDEHIPQDERRNEVASGISEEHDEGKGQAAEAARLATMDNEANSGPGQSLVEAPRAGYELGEDDLRKTNTSDASQTQANLERDAPPGYRDTAEHPVTETHALQDKSVTEKPGVQSPPPPPLPPKDDKYVVDQIPATGKGATASSSEVQYDEKHPPEDDAIADPQIGGQDGKSEDRSEIQSIMDQFEDIGPGLSGDGLSPRLERTQPIFPARHSSLEPLQSGSQVSPAPLHRTGSRESYTFSPSRIRPPSIAGGSISAQSKRDSIASNGPASPSIFQPPPPSPDPEPTLPFDFHRFLEQLRHRTADPVARFLRSFLLEFGKKQWMVHEQVKIISDFLEFITKKMSQCEVWRTVSDAEFDNAKEGMEKLVMNRLYSQTFSPGIPPPQSTPAGRNKRPQVPPVTGRRGQHQEDVERDDVIAQKIRIYGWIAEPHLDIAPIGDKGRKFILLAQQELLKINSYRAPRDKVICVLNCCKVIFGFLKNSQGDQSADAFVPLMIFTVLRANPEHLVSNLQYILRFRNQDKLGGEAGYYISSLMGVVTFIENLDRTNLTITDEEFESNVEAAVSAITEGHKAEEYEAKQQAAAAAAQLSSDPKPMAMKSALSRPEVTPRNSMDAERSSPRRNISARMEKASLSSDENADDTDAVTGLLRTIQKPLSSIGRMFSDDGSTRASQQQPLAPALTPLADQTPRQLSPTPQAARNKSEKSDDSRRTSPSRPVAGERAKSSDRRNLSAQDAAARQASADTAEAQRIRAQEHRIVVETLQGMFPDLDKDVIGDVVRMKEGRVGLAVDACLALSN